MSRSRPAAPGLVARFSTSCKGSRVPARSLQVVCSQLRQAHITAWLPSVRVIATVLTRGLAHDGQDGSAVTVARASGFDDTEPEDTGFEDTGFQDTGFADTGDSPLDRRHGLAKSDGAQTHGHGAWPTRVVLA